MLHSEAQLSAEGIGEMWISAVLHQGPYCRPLVQDSSGPLTGDISFSPRCCCGLRAARAPLPSGQLQHPTLAAKEPGTKDCGQQFMFNLMSELSSLVQKIYY